MKSAHSRLAAAALCTCTTLGLLGNAPAQAQFASQNVTLHAWLDLNDLGGAGNGNDCWGYTAPSGREYALMGVSNKLVVVEITTPSRPQIVGSISHTDSLWGDIKTYDDYCYVVNESGGGLDVVDLSDVDNGNVTLVQRVTTGGLSTSHNVAIDTASGFLYLCGANINSGRLVAYDLSDPANPVQAGSVNSTQGAYVHDAEIVTFDSGPHDGKQIAFCANGGTGLDIYDVTDKSNMFRLSRTTYANLSYAHQCWLGDDGQTLYLNDELDSVNETVIFDVSDLSAPQVVGSGNSGLGATDHNLYFRDGFIYEAEYRAGLRIFCAEDAANPQQVGWFDSYPENDSSGFDGAWSVYPLFPSGNVLISDIQRGLFIVDPSAALGAGALNMSYPQSRPALLDPAGGSTLQVEVAGSCGAEVAPGTAQLHYDAGAGLVSVSMDEVADGVYEGVFPDIPCGTEVAYYVSVEKLDETVVTDPPDAPSTAYTAMAAAGVDVLLQDNFEADAGWTAENLGASSGDWQRGIPVDDGGWDYDPGSDGDGSGQCWLTQNELGNTDVDDGTVRLTSSILDLSAGDLSISYEYYLLLTNTEGSLDRLLVEISSNGDAGPWTTIAVHDSSGGVAWRHHEISPVQLENAGVSLTSNMKLRFTANDAEPQSIVEAGIDGLTVTRFLCASGNPADVNNDGVVNVDDLLALVQAWGPCAGCPEDTNGDGIVNVLDLLVVLTGWTI